MSVNQIFSEKQSVWLCPVPGAEKVPGYVIGSQYVKIDGKNEIWYWVEVIHVLENGECVYEILSNVLHSMLSKAPMHPYPSHIRSMSNVKVSMNLPAHAVRLPANAGGKKHVSREEPGGRKRMRSEQPDDTDAEGSSSPIIHPVPEWPDDAMPGAEERQDPNENEMEEQRDDKEEAEVEDGEIRQSQIDVTLDTYPQAVAPSANPVFAWGVQPLTLAATAAPAPSTGAGASVSRGTSLCKPGQEEATLPITELSQQASQASQATLDITTHHPRF